LRIINQGAGIVEAEFKVFLREAGVFLSLSAFPFMFSLLTYGAGAALSGGGVSPEQWLYQLVGFTVMMVSLSMSSSSAWFFRRGLMTGRLEYLLASPVHVVIAVTSSALVNVIFNVIYFILVTSVGVVTVYGIGRLANLLGAILFLAAALVPVVGFNLIVGVSTIILREPEPITNVVNSIVSAVSGFTYPATLLPLILREVGRALPFSHIVEGARSFIAGSFQVSHLSLQLLMLVYLLLGLLIYNAGERVIVRKSGVSW